MTLFTTKRIATSAIILSSAVLLTACANYVLPGSSEAAAQESTEPTNLETLPVEEMDMGKMAMDEMSLEGLSDEEVRTKCAAMHQKMMSGDHKHKPGMSGMKSEGGMAKSPEMMAMHEKCMSVMPEVKAKHESCAAMKAEDHKMSGEGMMDEEKARQAHHKCMKMDDATPDETKPAPHSHDH
ncbi:MAG: hypothetical protein L3J02_03115 [Henriciella sp.]|nr:hypothetical protein [Henriciella sp.]